MTKRKRKPIVHPDLLPFTKPFWSRAMNNGNEYSQTILGLNVRGRLMRKLFVAGLLVLAMASAKPLALSAETSVEQNASAPASSTVELSVDVYNAAGEVVKHLYQGSSQIQSHCFTLNETTLILGKKAVTLIFSEALQNGEVSLVWHGLNDKGQEVRPGLYTIVAEPLLPFAANTSHCSQTVRVLN